MANGGGFSSDTKAGAIWNVVICGILCIGIPIAAIVNADRGSAYVGIGIAATVLALCMEVYFVRRLLAHRR
ncbi:hypothetical protein [Curtobacterium sp. BRB10]|jgi:Flp pilus assembly protein protease CpaA|uniref:hypothetical protein n=1 Tax=Curtobacterium TaxID=2034 RepID=UPI002882B37C|nr:hypothetical protein [Curtobacterium sp. BRB10]MDT0232970.1 hypothetical protein [Curtobacterium sp. BRB10]